MGKVGRPRKKGGTAKQKKIRKQVRDRAAKFRAKNRVRLNKEARERGMSKRRAGKK